MANFDDKIEEMYDNYNAKKSTGSNGGGSESDVVKDDRMTWDEYFFAIVDVVKMRATCLRRSVGAVIAKDNRVLATGYNGAPNMAAHASEIGCLREAAGVASGTHHEICRGLHAEQNAILSCAKHGIAIEGATIYCNYKPCSICTKMIMNSGIVRVVYREDYPDMLGDALSAERSDISFELFKGR